MKAIAIVPGRPETAGLIELPEPPASDGSVWSEHARSESAAPMRKSPSTVSASLRRERNDLSWDTSRWER